MMNRKPYVTTEGKVIYGSFKVILDAIIRDHNGRTANDRRNSRAKTRAERAQKIRKAFEDLAGLGYRLADPRNLGERHVIALVKKWEDDGLSPSSIQNRLSFLRTFSRWIGKAGMVKVSEHYSDRARRTLVAKKDLSWSGNGVDFEKVLAEVAKDDPHVAIQMELQRYFGMRREESWLFRPHLDDRGHAILLERGTKGGRPRMVPVETDKQREVLERAKTFAKTPNASTIPTTRTLKSWRDHYEHLIRKHGITRKGLGVTSHGLRHEYMQERYLELTGKPVPIKGGTVDGSEKLARLQVCAELGHNRVGITSAYGGSFKHQSSSNTNQTKEQHHAREEYTPHD